VSFRPQPEPTPQWRGATRLLPKLIKWRHQQRTLNAIHLDPQSDDVLFRAMAEELITEHEVNVIFGNIPPAAEKRCHRLLKNIVGCCFVRNKYQALSFQKIFLWRCRA
jgi:branched-chain amino acid transport system substrate-binding protein